MTKLNTLVVAAAVVASASAFAPASKPVAFSRQAVSVRMSEEPKQEAVFVAPDETPVQDDKTLETVEKFGKGAAKVCFMKV